MEPTQDSAPISTDDAVPTQETRTSPYELMVIFPAALEEEGVMKAREKLTTLFDQRGVNIIEEEDLGKRKLAYPIQHIRQGFYHLYKFEAPRLAIQKLNNDLRLMSGVLRHLLTTREVKSQAQLDAENALRERIQAKRVAEEERAVADRHLKEAEGQTERAAQQPTRDVSKEELEKKLEEILTDESMGE